MKKGILLLLVSVSFWQCSKEATGDTNIPADVTILSQGIFSPAAHNTSGVVKLASDAQGKKYLLFENFMTDSGPETSGYGLLGIKPRKIIPRLSKTVPTGNFKIDVPASADTNKHSYVLIWCKQFTVLFGSAQLK